MCKLILEFIPSFSSILALITLIIGVLSYKEKNTLQKIESLMQLHKFYLDDKELVEIFNKLEWNSGKEVVSFTMEDLQKYSFKMEKFFSFFEYILILKQEKWIKKEDIAVYDYMIQRVVSHPTIKLYFSSTLLPHIKSENLPNPYPKLSLLIKN